MVDGAAIPVIAGMAIGIVFIILFASVFGNINPSAIIDRKLDVWIEGISETYGIGQPITFTFHLMGLVDQSCSSDYPQVTIRNKENEIVQDLTVSFYGSVCHVGLQSIEKHWSYGTSTVENNNSTGVAISNAYSMPITLNDTGYHLLQLAFNEVRLDKEFVVTDMG